MSAYPLFDAAASEALKEAGMELAADNRDLATARRIVRNVAASRTSLEATADDNPIDLGPAAGSLFFGEEWEFTGRRVKSARITNHARELKVWRLKAHGAKPGSGGQEVSGVLS